MSRPEIGEPGDFVQVPHNVYFFPLRPVHKIWPPVISYFPHNPRIMNNRSFHVILGSLRRCFPALENAAELCRAFEITAPELWCARARCVRAAGELQAQVSSRGKSQARSDEQPLELQIVLETCTSGGPRIPHNICIIFCQFLCFGHGGPCRELKDSFQIANPA